MKKIFDLIKQIFIDNKEYFIKFTLMSIIAAFILGLAISFVVPASAASDPSDGITISAGAYKWNDSISWPATSVTNESHGLLSISLFDISFSDGSDDVSITFSGDFEAILCSSVDVFNIDSPFLVYSSANESEGVIATIVYNGETITQPFGAMSLYFDGVQTEAYLNYQLDKFKVNESVTFTDVGGVEFASWFLANTELIGSPDPDPDPDPQEYLIESGYYENRGVWNTSVFPAMNDSIDIRYYDEFNDGYVDTEGMIFTIDNEIVTIYYGDNAVYTDGWNSYAYQYIEITADINVDSDFYTAFTSVFAPSTQAGNDFQSGYYVGYEEGRRYGYDEGYQQGFLEGANEDGTFFGNIIEGVLDSLDKLVIVGDFSILDIIKTVIGAFVLIFFLKLIAGG